MNNSKWERRLKKAWQIAAIICLVAGIFTKDVGQDIVFMLMAIFATINAK